MRLSTGADHSGGLMLGEVNVPPPQQMRAVEPNDPTRPPVDPQLSQNQHPGR